MHPEHVFIDGGDTSRSRLRRIASSSTRPSYADFDQFFEFLRGCWMLSLRLRLEGPVGGSGSATSTRFVFREPSLGNVDPWSAWLDKSLLRHPRHGPPLVAVRSQEFLTTLSKAGTASGLRGIHRNRLCSSAAGSAECSESGGPGTVLRAWMPTATGLAMSCSDSAIRRSSGGSPSFMSRSRSL